MKTHLCVGASILALSAFCLAAITNVAHADEWQGSYAGLTLGQSRLDTSWKAKAHYLPVLPPVAIPFSSDPTASFDDQDATYGIYAGHNWRLSNSLLLGAELTLRDGRTSATHTTIPGTNTFANPAPYPYSSLTVKSDWDASLRARLGYLVSPSTLVYATGGLAFQRVKLSGDCPRDTNVCNPGTAPKHESATSNQTGWTLGLGAETFFTKYLVGRVEYSYADYGSVKFTPVRIVPGEAFGITGNIKNTTQSLTLGLAYKF